MFPSSPAPGFAGAMFDVDGVLVDSPHERAANMREHAAGKQRRVAELISAALTEGRLERL